MSAEQDDLMRRLDAGEWLRPGEVAALLDASRSTVNRLLAGGSLRYREKPGTGRHREVNPDDVRREMSARTLVHGDAADDAQ